MSLPSRHNHAGQMSWYDNRCECDGCGQTWMMQRVTDKAGKVLCKWAPVSPY